MRKLVLFGAGGHARVVIDAIQAGNQAQCWAVLDSDPGLWNTELFGVPVRGGDDCLCDMIDEGVDAFVIAVGGPLQRALRRRLFENAESHLLQPFTVVHPSAQVSPHATVEEGAQLHVGSIVNASAQVRTNAIVNTAAIVEHDCVVEPHAHVAPRAVLAGGVHIGMGAHIGAGAVIRENISVGARAIVGAGAVVIRDVPPDAVVAGVPARPIVRARSLTESAAA
ncbi:MAG: acetyltransferase [Planctomycetaceae bacterium]